MAATTKHDMPAGLQSLFLIGGAIYISIYSLEGVVRYGLSLAGADNAILARDLLIWLPLISLFLYQAVRLKVERSFVVYAAVIALHGSLIYLSFHTTTPVVYGAKLLINVLFGFVAGNILTHPGRRVLRLFALLWAVGLVGLGLEKFFFDMPWVGMSAKVGGLTVDVSHNWDIVDPLQKRVAGFTRGSIAAATIFPILALLISVRIRSWWLRAFVLLATAAAVFATTQKGSLVAFAAVMCLLLGPLRWRVPLLRLTCLGFVVALVALPLLTSGMMLPMTGGVFSMGSFAMRIDQTWPWAWDWISHNEIIPYVSGVGLGGIGGPQRFFAPDFFNPADNLFVFLYGNFGLASVFYLGALCSVVVRMARRPPPETIGALATLAFLLGYGTVLSLIEDQMSSLFLGACAGALWRVRARRQATREEDDYAILEPEFARQPELEHQSASWRHSAEGGGGSAAAATS